VHCSNEIRESPDRLWRSYFWENAVPVYELSSREFSEWAMSVVIRVERELLNGMSDTRKKEMLSKSFNKSSNSIHADEQDEEVDPKLLNQMKNKLNNTTLSEGAKETQRVRESDDWRQLPTTQVYLGALSRLGAEGCDRFEDAEEYYPRQYKQLVDRWGGLRPGRAGFNDMARKLMKEDRLPMNEKISAPQPGTPIVQPYQETVSWLVHPLSFKDPRLLVCHRTGAGKTCSMIRVFDNFFNDRRPKIAIFPTTAVCNNFYMELLDPKFPNRCQWMRSNARRARAESVNVLRCQASSLRVPGRRGVAAAREQDWRGSQVARAKWRDPEKRPCRGVILARPAAPGGTAARIQLHPGWRTAELW
jgi:hypothetical protein